MEAEIGRGEMEERLYERSFRDQYNTAQSRMRS